MTVPRPVRSDTPASVQPDADPKGKPPAIEAPMPEAAGVDRDSAADSGSAAGRVMKQTSKTPAEGGDLRPVV